VVKVSSHFTYLPPFLPPFLPPSDAAAIVELEWHGRLMAMFMLSI